MNSETSPRTADPHADSSHSPIHGFWVGSLFWIFFTGLAIAFRGVQWDENYEFAQAMIGQVPYDDAHPLRQYTLAAYNLQFYSSALILLINENPIWLCGFRNALFIASTVLPIFLLGSWISGRTLVGHAATVLFLMGIHIEFDGVYPQFLWPGMFSNGHVGIAYVLIYAGLLARGHLRWAGLLLGLMPAIHLGQMPPALVLAGCYALHCAWTRHWCPLKHAVAYFSIGMVFCAFFYAFQQTFVLPPVTDGPYFSEAPIEPIWQGHVATRDMHRAIPTGNIHIVTIAFLCISIGGWRHLSKVKSPQALCWGWLSLYGYAVIAIVYSISTVHLFMENDIPYLLIGWLPYRLLNHLAPLLVVMAVSLIGALASDKNLSSLALFLPLAFLFELLKPLYPHLIGDSLAGRYFTQNDSLFFALIAWSGVSLLFNTFTSRKIIALLLGITFLFITRHQFGAAVFLVAGLSAYALLHLPRTPSSKWITSVSYALGALVILSILYQSYQHRAHLPVGQFEHDIVALLEAEGQPDALIAGPPAQVLLQAQTGHPIFTDMATEFHASYRPSLAPSVQKMYEDVYGIWFEQRDTVPFSWHTVWNKRNPEEWYILKERYNIQYLIAHDDVQPQLEKILEGDGKTLYRMPK